MIKGIRPSLAQAGAIKIGKLSDKELTAKSGMKWRPPVKLDHFLVTKPTRGADGNLEVDEPLMAALHKAGFADSDRKVRSIPIVLHSDNIDDVFPTTYAWYHGRQVVCRGDGEKATRWQVTDGKKTGATKEIACPCPFLERDEKGVQKCKPHGTLHCTIALPGHAIAGAVYRYRTTGIISVQRVIGSLEQILAIVGTVANIPLVLRVTPVTVSPDGKTQTVYSVHVELRQDVIVSQKAALEARRSRAELGAPKVVMRALLQAPASDDESPEEQADVADEFYPPSTDEDAPKAEPVNKTQSVKTAAEKTAKRHKKADEPPPRSDSPIRRSLGPEKTESREETKEGMVQCSDCGASCSEKALYCYACGLVFPGGLASPQPQKPDSETPDYGTPDHGLPEGKF